MTDWLNQLQLEKAMDYQPARRCSAMPRLKDAPPDMRRLIATDKIKVVAREVNWPLDDLLEWFKPNIDEIVEMDMGKLCFIIKDYIHNIDSCRSEDGYQPIGSLIPDIEPEPVKCKDCQNFITDPIGYGGIGDCALRVRQEKPLYPNAIRKCMMHINKQINTKS